MTMAVRIAEFGQLGLEPIVQEAHSSPEELKVMTGVMAIKQGVYRDDRERHYFTKVLADISKYTI